jgi:MFS family permease
MTTSCENCPPGFTKVPDLTKVADSRAGQSAGSNGHAAVGAGDGASPDISRRAITAALLLVMVLASMEQTVTSTAMPTIIGSLHGLQHYSWVASIYLLACTLTMPLYGRLADALGRKRVILAAIGIFAIGSVLAASAQTMPQLILYRGLQGLGAGGIMPVVLTILGDIFTIEERARIQGLFSAVWGTASLAGPALGWFLLRTMGWRSIFYVNLPFGFLAFVVLVWKYRDREKPTSVDLDLPGVGSLALGCMALLMLVSRLGPGGWSAMILAMLGATMILAFSFLVMHERKALNPIMPVALLLDRSIGISLLGSLLLGVGFLSVDTFVPLYVQGGLGGGPGAAAWVVTPVMLTWALSGIVAAPMVVRFGFRRVAIIGSFLIFIGLGGLLLCTYLGAPRTVLALTLGITGLGFGPASMSYLLAAQNAVSWQRRGIVTSSIQFFRTIGGAIGIGLFGAMFNIIAAPQLSSLAAQGASPAALLDAHTRSTLPPSILETAGHVIAGSLHWIFVAMFLVAIVQVICTFWLPKQKSPASVTVMEAAEAMVG